MKNILLLLVLSAFASGRAYGAIERASVDKCKGCHEGVVNSFLDGTHHGKAWSKDQTGPKYNCETCHGNGDQHINDNKIESIISFSKKSAQKPGKLNDVCMNCHGKSSDLMFWSAGKHKRNDVACSSCHSIHKEKQIRSASTCFSCHKDIRSQVNRFSHHPILEGKVTCVDCHNPHGTLSHGMIRAETNNQLCYRCHADKRGPFVFEHPPVEENCMSCHNPHGSQHFHLLTQKLPNLCQDCHDFSRHPGTPYDGKKGFRGTRDNKLIARSCLNCHDRIHGSMAPHNPAFPDNSGKVFTR
ncbi:MAG: hypothetical protein A2428_15095 [Bdellovibrionales bacterium RIFOXYC1_FULL_54_43]|nr:MAG: hypothetical protein A2428_15095 [Bdellovibrionales bacterium RIFOXYC1_FULL_54_43]OFZ82279.1 MAG: hypothetical protein A2603_01170 [Bdellovibrionales bacterium RIFOXYD1_FULL_55_31]